jgi:ketosteroid isomerase-like protein
MKPSSHLDENSMKHRVISSVAAIWFTGCAVTASQIAPRAPATALPAINQTLDTWHQAASRSDEATYFRLFAPDAVFLGTDATERWTLDSFRAYVHPYFSQGKGWTFIPRARHVFFSEDGGTAWFDESLDSVSYGECRGTGVLRNLGGEWRISQYNLTVPLPNALAKQVVRMIREQPAPLPTP